MHRPARRGNGSPDRLQRGPANDLRHVQGGGPEDDDGRGALDGEARGKSGHFVVTSTTSAAD